MALPRLGSTWMVLAGFFFALMGLCVQEAASGFTSAELVFYRSLFALFVLLFLSRAGGLSLRTPHWRGHIARSLSGFTAMMLFFYALTHLPLATAITLNNTSPLFLALLTVLVDGERHGYRLRAALLLGFIGVAVLLQPSFTGTSLATNLAGLASGMLAGVAYYTVRQLGALGESDLRTVFYFTLTSTVGSGLWMLTDTVHPLSLGQLPLIAGIGVLGTLGQLAMTRAYREGRRALATASLAYSAVVFASILGLLVRGQWLSAANWAGIAIIVMAGILAIHGRQPSPAAVGRG